MALALLFYILFLNKTDKKINTFSIINRIKHFFLGNIVIYEARGQLILPKGFINHDIAQQKVFYHVFTYTQIQPFQIMSTGVLYG